MDVSSPPLPAPDRTFTQRLALVLGECMDQRNTQQVLNCPAFGCGDNYQHVGLPFVVDGRDEYAAHWGGRGDLVVVPFWGECGHTWEVCFGFHKGDTVIFTIRPGRPGPAETYAPLPYPSRLWGPTLAPGGHPARPLTPDDLPDVAPSPAAPLAGWPRFWAWFWRPTWISPALAFATQVGIALLLIALWRVLFA